MSVIKFVCAFLFMSLVSMSHVSALDIPIITGSDLVSSISDIDTRGKKPVINTDLPGFFQVQYGLLSVRNGLEDVSSIIQAIFEAGLYNLQTNQIPLIQAQITPPVAGVQTNLGQEERTRSVIIMFAAIVLIITLGALILMLIIRGRKLSREASAGISEAYLVDVHGYTANRQYRLGKKATMLGRVAGKDTSNMDYFVIPEATIGRRHAVIEYKDYAYWILDQGSINGTFVNDIPVTSEIRLKHGDMVRLHKYEFEFSIPELDEAGQTKISDTLMAGHMPGTHDSEQADIDRVKQAQGDQAFELDPDFSGSEPAPSAEQEDKPAVAVETGQSEDETLLPGHDLVGDDTIDGTDETLMPDFASITSGQERPDSAADKHTPAGPEPRPPPQADAGKQHFEPDGHADETLMPGLFSSEDEDEDATIRPDNVSSADDIIDITRSEDEK